MDYVLFGIQGSGKGTQGKILAGQKRAAYFEMGGELRRLAAENSELGRKVKNIIDAGNLVPTEVIMEIVENFARTAGARAATSGEFSIIWDGIPRNKEQNEKFEALLLKLGRKYTGIYFELSREDAENRLLKRRLCEKCKTVFPASYKNAICEKCGGQLITRADDNADSIRRRLELFFTETLPVAEAWRRGGRLISINGEGHIQEISKNLLSSISSHCLQQKD